MKTTQQGLVFLGLLTAVLLQAAVAERRLLQTADVAGRSGGAGGRGQGTSQGMGEKRGHRVEWRADADNKKNIPQSNSGAKATMRFTENNGTINGTVSIKNIRNFTEAHLHVGNQSETTEMILFWVWPLDGLNVTKQPLSGTFQFPWRVTAADLANTSVLSPPDMPGAENYTTFLDLLNAGRVYLNIHTQRYPTGEIRGQVFNTSASDDDDD